MKQRKRQYTSWQQEMQRLEIHANTTTHPKYSAFRFLI